MPEELNELERSLLRDCREMELQFHRMWIKVVTDSPQLAGYCPCWNDFTTGEWAVLLSHNASFANIAPLHKLARNEWVHILTWQPELVKLCPLTETFSTFQRNYLIDKHPQLKDMI